jgi:hypothetical protein
VRIWWEGWWGWKLFFLVLDPAQAKKCDSNKATETRQLLGAKLRTHASRTTAQPSLTIHACLDVDTSVR